MLAHNIPDDILVLIFEASATLEPPREYKLGCDSGWIRLGHVSRRWRILILNLPLLWTRIVCTFRSEEARRVVLERSRDLPLLLDFHLHWCDYVIGPKTIIDRLVPRAHTILSPWGDQRGSLVLTGLSLPLLQKLDIEKCYDPQRFLSAPSLNHLIIRSIPWTIHAPHLRNLRLVIDQTDLFSPLIAELPSLLAKSPTLESFYFKYGPIYSSRDSASLHNVRRTIRSGLDLLADRGPAVEMQCLAFLTVEIDTRGSFHGQFAALLATMLCRLLAVPSGAAVSFDLSELNQEFLQAMETRLAQPELETLTITHRWPELEFAVDSQTAMFGQHRHTVAQAPEGAKMLFMDVLDHFSGSASAFIRTLRLVSCSLPEPRLSRQHPKNSTSCTSSYALVESLEVHGPASMLTRTLALYTFPNLQRITLYTPQHDHHELMKLARVLCARPIRLKQLILRGKTAYKEEIKLAREVSALRLHDSAEVVIDEREGIFKWTSKAQSANAGEAMMRKGVHSAAGHHSVSSNAVVERRRKSAATGSRRGARASGGAETTGRASSQVHSVWR